MKKTLLLVMLTAFASLAATAQVVLGDAKWSVRDGAKVNPAKTITLAFPNAEGVNEENIITIAGNIFPADGEPTEDNAFDGLQANATDAVPIPLEDFDFIEPNSSYVLQITSILIDDVEVIGDTVYTLNFKTRSAERQLSWTFTIDEESVKKIKADEEAGGGTTGTYWQVVGADTRHSIHKKLDNEEIMLDENNALPMTEGLQFTAGADKMYVGDVVTTTYKENLVFNANHLYITIPDCKAGDRIAFTAIHAAKNGSKNKYASIMSQDGTAVAVDGFVSEQATNPDGVKDSITLNGTKTAYKFEVQQDGDITFKLGNARVFSIDITEAIPVVDCTYKVVAQYKEEDAEPVQLKEYVPETVGKTNDIVKVSYSYWLTDGEGNLYTAGTKGTEFTQKFDLVSDTTFVINYKKVEGVSEVKFLAEAEGWVDEESLESVVQYCTNANSAVRSSNCKAAYATADWTVVTLPAGTYKIKAVLFDSQKTASFVANFAVGTEEIPLAANSTNFAEVESEPFEVTEETEVIWKAGGGENNGIDILVIYATDELPEPDYEPGDVNGDNEITMADANAVVNYFLASDTEKAQMIENNFNVEAADVNTDGDITMADANAIVNIFLGVAGEGEKE